MTEEERAAATEAFFAKKRRQIAGGTRDDQRLGLGMPQALKMPMSVP